MRKHGWNILGLAISFAIGWSMLIWAIWQIDVDAGGAGTLAPHWTELFGLFLYPSPYQIVLQKGFAYELLLVQIALAAIVLTFGTLVSIWFWED